MKDLSQKEIGTRKLCRQKKLLQSILGMLGIYQADHLTKADQVIPD